MSFCVYIEQRNVFSFQHVAHHSETQGHTRVPLSSTPPPTPPSPGDRRWCYNAAIRRDHQVTADSRSSSFRPFYSCIRRSDSRCDRILSARRIFNLRYDGEEGGGRSRDAGAALVVVSAGRINSLSLFVHKSRLPEVQPL